MKKGYEKPGHKWIKRLVINGKYRYFYTSNEYASFLRSKEGKTMLADKGNAAINVLRNRPNANQMLMNTLSERNKAIAGKVVANTKKATAKKKEEQKQVVAATEEGKKKIAALQEKETKKGKKKGSSKSSSSKSSGKKGRSSSSKSSSSKKEKTEKETKTSAKKETAAKTTNEAKVATNTQQAQQIKKTSVTPILGLDSLKKLYGVSESNKHNTVQDSIDNMKKYPDGAFGYLRAGNTVYKWSKQDGKITFTDYNTDKEVALQIALTDVEEFRTDKKKKKG